MKQKVVEQLCGERCGIIDTAVSGLKLFRYVEDKPREPFLYGASIIIICQGKKTGHIKGRQFVFDEETYLIVTGSLPLECEYLASKDKALLGVLIEIDPVLLRAVQTVVRQSLDGDHFDAQTNPSIVAPKRHSRAFEEVLCRLLKHLEHADRTKLFVEDAIKELYYHLLREGQASSLYAMLDDGKFSRILSAMEYIRTHFEKPLSVEVLAAMCNMSPTNFYRTFKDQTGDTPLQFVKKTRLAFAKSILEQRSCLVKQVANSVGYESPSHFSRDFKRLFGYLPATLQKQSFGLEEL